MFQVTEAVDTDRRLSFLSKKALTITMKIKKSDFEGLRKLTKSRTKSNKEQITHAWTYFFAGSGALSFSAFKSDDHRVTKIKLDSPNSNRMLVNGETVQYTVRVKFQLTVTKQAFEQLFQFKKSVNWENLEDALKTNEKIFLKQNFEVGAIAEEAKNFKCA